MFKALSDFLFGLCFGLGFLLAQAVRNVLAAVLSAAGHH